MAYTRKYVEANREKINEKRRVKYSAEDRKAEYQQKREEILRKGKEDRANCPLCGLDFRRLYIPKHIATRHAPKKITCPNDLSVHLYGSE
jgi:hypothetical protein